jgi:NAD(P)-dependent dehydrogenase (short-subunit alcohol dehydrogenase family)
MNTLQKPIHSGFSASSTAEEVIRGVDLSGKIAIVTGGYAGIGLETTRVLCMAGARVIVPARDHEKALSAMKGLGDVEIGAMDLLAPASVDAFAASFLASGRPLHILVNSAGIMANPLTRDDRGYESQLATNHLGHFQLTARLWPALCQAGGARVVSLSSRGHRYSPFVFEDPNFQHREYDRWKAYGQSKTANILFALALDRQGQAEQVRAFSVHPGSIIATDLKRYLSDDDLKKAGVIDNQGKPILDPARQLKTIAQGAATSVWCATSPQLDELGGVYCENAEISGVVPVEATEDWINGNTASMEGVLPYAVDPDLAERLWSLSEQLTGVSIQF